MSESDITSEIVPCPQCDEPLARMSPITVAIVVLLSIILIYKLVCLGSGLAGRRGEGFVSQRAYEVSAQAKELFAKDKGASTYSDYKSNINNADVAQYQDVKDLWKKGELTPENVERVL